MAEYRISGIWVDNNDMITHYAIHKATYNNEKKNYTIDHAVKMKKSDAVDLLLKSGNIAKTYIWDYAKSRWLAGAEIQVIKDQPLYIRTKPDSTEKNNLSNLINYGFVF